MTQTIPATEALLSSAIHALNEGNGCRAAIDALSVPIYVTDEQGSVTYWNQACVDFAGREPELGKDRWCVTWKIYTTTGELMPHDQCPMAEAIRDRRPIRGKVAIAMRPDGSRKAFTPYPTPLFDEAGNLKGAINMLVDVTDQQAVTLADQAARCRRLAGATHDRQASELLDLMAEGYDDTACALRAKAA